MNYVPGMPQRDTNDRSKLAIGVRLRLTREAMGITQVEFAGRAGIAPNTYNQYEAGKNFPQIEYAQRLCDAHGLTLDWIYRGDLSNLSYQLAEAIRAIRTARQ